MLLYLSLLSHFRFLIFFAYYVIAYIPIKILWIKLNSTIGVYYLEGKFQIMGAKEQKLWSFLRFAEIALCNRAQLMFKVSSSEEIVRVNKVIESVCVAASESKCVYENIIHR